MKMMHIEWTHKMVDVWNQTHLNSEECQKVIEKLRKKASLSTADLKIYRELVREIMSNPYLRKELLSN